MQSVTRPIYTTLYNWFGQPLKESLAYGCLVVVSQQYKTYKELLSLIRILITDRYFCSFACFNGFIDPYIWSIAL